MQCPHTKDVAQKSVNDIFLEMAASLKAGHGGKGQEGAAKTGAALPTDKADGKAATQPFVAKVGAKVGAKASAKAAKQPKANAKNAKANANANANAKANAKGTKQPDARSGARAAKQPNAKATKPRAAATAKPCPEGAAAAAKGATGKGTKGNSAKAAKQGVAGIFLPTKAKAKASAPKPAVADVFLPAKVKAAKRKLKDKGAQNTGSDAEPEVVVVKTVAASKAGPRAAKRDRAAGKMASIFMSPAQRKEAAEAQQVPLPDVVAVRAGLLLVLGTLPVVAAAVELLPRCWLMPCVRRYSFRFPRPPKLCCAG